MLDAPGSTWLIVPKQRVVVVVVDVDDHRVADVDGVAVEVAAVQEDDRALRDVLGDVGDQPVELKERVLVGQRELVAADEHQRVLAERLQHPLQRDERAERVAVGAAVRHEREALPVAQRRESLFARRCADPGDGHASSAWRRMSSSSIIARSVVSS